LAVNLQLKKYRMGESDRYQEYKQQRGRNRFLLGQADNALVWLVAVNVMLFIIILFVRVIYNFSSGANAGFESGALPIFQLPASFGALAYKPWTLLGYMFSDVRVMGLLGNMLWLWAFGYILQDMAGNRKLIPIFIYGGLAGGLFFIAAHSIFPYLRPAQASSVLMGANAAVTAIALAATSLAPDYRFFRNIGKGIPIWVLTAIYLLVAFAGLADQSAAYSLATLGGALAGFLFVMLLRRGYDGSVWMNNFYNWVKNMGNPNKKNSAPAKQQAFYNTGNRKPYTKTTHITQQRVDEILDKINQKGYQFLTDDEKNILKKASEEDL
jgi:membrane associated rhomboid family serine protease